MISSSASRYFNIKRKTAFLLPETTVAASMTLTRSIQIVAYMEVTISGGTDGTGTVEITGTSRAGASQSETLTFARNGTQQTVRQFASVTAIATTGFTSEATVPTIQVRSISSDGSELWHEYTIATDVPAVMFTFGGAEWEVPVQGSREAGRGTMVIDWTPDYTPQVGDSMYDVEISDRWQVRSSEEVRVGFGVRPHHFKIGVLRLDS